MNNIIQVQRLNERGTILRDAYISADNTILGAKTLRINEWISDTTWAKVQKKNNVKENLYSTKTRAQKSQRAKQHQVISKEVKINARRDEILSIGT